MTNLKWHADQLNQISSSMKSTRKTSRAADLSAADDGAGREFVKRSRPNQLLRKLRNAQRHRQAQIARPPKSDGGGEDALLNSTSPMALWSQRGVMLALVPLSIVGMATLFVLGFIGSKQVVGYLVGQDYVPVALNSDDRQSTEIAPSVAAPPASPPDKATTGDTVDNAPSSPDTPAVVDRSEPSEATDVTAPAATPAPVEEDVAKVSQIATVPADYQPPDYDGIAAMESEGTTVLTETSTTALKAPVPEETRAVDTAEPAPTETAPVVAPAAAEPEIAQETPAAISTTAETVQDVSETQSARVETSEPSVTAAAPVVTEVPKPVEEAAPKTQARVVAEPEESEPTTVTAAQTEEEPQIRRDRDDESDELRKKQAARTVAEPTVAEPTVAEPATAEPAAAEPTVAEPQVVDAAHLIGKGHTLMASGRISEARQLFTKGLTSGSAEAALALGRSYDPKHLASVGADPSLADAAVARKWYAEWYRRSVEQGAISQNVKLERLLQAMNLN